LEGYSVGVANSTRLTCAWAASPMVAARSAIAAIRHRRPCRRDTTSKPVVGAAELAEPAVLGHPPHGGKYTGHSLS
jgi:hypothetical protein